MRRTFFDFAVTLACLSLLGFVVWHGYYGERSLEKSKALEARVERLGKSLAAVRAEREALEARVNLLRPESIDPDMVEEMARFQLGFTREGDLVLDIGR